MADITKVRIHDYKDGRQTVFVYYRNKNRYRNDRVRFFTSLPNSAKKFIETAKHTKARECSDFISTEFSKW